MSAHALSPEKIALIVESITNPLRDQLGKIELPLPIEVERTSASLVSALAAIREANGQAPALRALLAASRSLGARAAVFVLRGEQVELWESQGFSAEAEAAVAGVRIDASEEAIAAAIASGSVSCGLDGPRVPAFGQGDVTRAQLEPIRVQGKVVGLLYADSTNDELPFDTLGIQVLVEFTGLAVEGIALLRAIGRDLTGAVEGSTGPVAVSAPRASTTPASQEAPSEATDDTPAAPTVPEAATLSPSPLPTAPPPGTVESAAAEDARRFARLLMEEICLYNGDKVEAGRSGNDLLVRLGDEIEQARAMYAQRVPGDVSTQGDFFEEAMVQVLAGGDRSAL